MAVLNNQTKNQAEPLAPLTLTLGRLWEESMLRTKASGAMAPFWGALFGPCFMAGTRHNWPLHGPFSYSAGDSLIPTITRPPSERDPIYQRSLFCNSSQIARIKQEGLSAQVDLSHDNGALSGLQQHYDTCAYSQNKRCKCRLSIILHYAWGFSKDRTPQ